MLNIVSVGLNYKNSPIDIREQFAFDKTDLENGITQLSQLPSVEECTILSTCNRVEIYAVSSEPERCAEEIQKFFSDFHKVSEKYLNPYLAVLHHKEAIRHLLRVAASLDSMVIGEPQILGQVKQSYRTAHAIGTTRLILNRLFHYTFSIAKKVRYETKIGSNAVSVGYAAVELAKRIFDDLGKRSIMLIGAGEMGELAAKHLISAGVKEFYVASRSFENAQELARQHNGAPIRIEEIHYYLRKTDIVITATGSNDFIIRQDHIHDSLKLRRNEPMFLIDIAVPRNIDPRVEEIANVYLYDIDDLQGVLEDNMKTRIEHAERAEEIVNSGVETFQYWLDSLKVVPTIISIKNKFEEIKDSEVRKALSRLEHLSEKDKNTVEALASGIVGKMLHNPLTKLKKEASTSLGAFYSSTAQMLFDLNPQLELLEDDEDTDNEASA